MPVYRSQKPTGFKRRFHWSDVGEFEELHCEFNLIKMAQESVQVLDPVKQARNALIRMERPWIRWEHPIPGTVKINTDACKRGPDGLTAIAAVIRDHDGNWIKGFMGMTGYSNIYLAELKAIRQAMVVARQLGLTRVTIESDSDQAVKALYGTNEDISVDHVIIEDCRALLKSTDWDCGAVWNPREGNKLADALAAMGHAAGIPFTMLDDPPAQVLDILNEDKKVVSRFG